MIRNACLFAWALAFAPLAGASPPMLTQDGYGDLKIGMSEASAMRVLGISEADVGEGAVCRVIDAQGQPGLQAMIERGRLSRIAVSGAAAMKTDAGVAIGSSESAIYKAYPNVRSDGGFVDDGAPWQELYVQPKGRDGRGVRFTIDGKGKVAAMYAGGPSIEYPDGCP
jgi:hypothetical protein